MNTIRAAVVLLLGILLSGCNNIGAVHPLCDEIVILRTQIARAGSPEQLRTWIADTYRITLDSIQVDPLPQQAHLLQWQSDGLWYNMTLANGVVAAIGADARGLSATDVIACLVLQRRIIEVE